MLSPMRYKDFTWPHNPSHYEITFSRLTAVHKVPMGVYTMQDLGRTRRVLSGRGVFYGPDAYDTFRALATVFYDEGPGQLIHPVWDASEAYFTDLSLEMEPKADYVAYRFSFAEGFSQYGGMTLLVDSQAATAAPTPTGDAAAQYYAVVSGDTLWAIAQRCGTTLANILALNPEIANPNLILPGQQVRVA